MLQKQRASQPGAQRKPRGGAIQSKAGRKSAVKTGARNVVLALQSLQRKCPDFQWVFAFHSVSYDNGHRIYCETGPQLRRCGCGGSFFCRQEQPGGHMADQRTQLCPACAPRAAHVACNVLSSCSVCTKDCAMCSVGALSVHIGQHTSTIAQTPLAFAAELKAISPLAPSAALLKILADMLPDGVELKDCGDNLPIYTDAEKAAELPASARSFARFMAAARCAPDSSHMIFRFTAQAAWHTCLAGVHTWAAT